MEITINELIREYSKAILKGDAAVFAGAGLSVPSGYANWKDFLRPFAEDLHLDIEREHDLLDVAQFYCNTRRNRGAINNQILNAYTSSAELNENVIILTRLPITTYWTTNYDSLIEQGLQLANRRPDVKYESDQIPYDLYDRDAVVYKMHGDSEHPADAVLTKHDYETYDQKYPLFRTILKGDLVSKSFLFIGFSFEDPNMDYILSEIRTTFGQNVREHYCFFKRVQRDDFENDLEYGYALAKQELREQDLRQYGIQTCFVNSYVEITDILQKIEAATRLKHVFISGSAHEYSAPWDVTLAESFSKALASRLVENDYRITTGFGLGIGSSVINGALDVIYQSKYRHIDEHLCLRPFPQNISDPDERANKFEIYRNDMLEDVGIAIFIFGNKKADNGVINADGCKREFEIAVKKGRIVIPVGSTGYMAQELLDIVKQEPEKYPYLDGYIDWLETETDPYKLIDLIMEIINNQQIK